MLGGEVQSEEGSVQTVLENVILQSCLSESNTQMPGSSYKIQIQDSVVSIIGDPEVLCL